MEKSFFDTLKEISKTCVYDENGDFLWSDKTYEDILPKNLYNMSGFSGLEKGTFIKKFFACNKMFILKLSKVHNKKTLFYIGSIQPYEEVFTEIIPEINTVMQNLTSSYRERICNIVAIAKTLTASLEEAELYEDIEALRRQVNNCYNLLRQADNIEQLERYIKGFYNPQLLDLSQTVHIFMDSILSTVPSRNFKFKCCDENIPVCVDEKAFFSAFINIISNSLCYSPEEETVFVSVEKIGKNAVITIRDNGFGISVEEQKNIFDFGYTDKDMNTSSKLGIGLYLAKLFTLACNGAIMVSSKENNGTTITLKIPISSNGKQLDLNSLRCTYFTGLFSPVGIALCDIENCKLYDLM